MTWWIMMGLLACSGPSSKEDTSGVSTDIVTDPSTSTSSPSTSTYPSSTTEDSTAPCDGLVQATEGAYLGWTARVEGTRERCEAAAHAFHAPQGTQMEIGLLEWTAEGSAQLQVLDWNGSEIASWNGLTNGDRVSFTFPWSGELLLRLGPDDTSAERNAYSLGLLCTDNCEHEGSRYPILFMHGMAGTDSWLSIVDYWWQVPEHLEPRGYSILAPAVDPFQTSAVRAQQWNVHLNELYASGRARRVHLFGHSQGGLDARWLTTHLDPEHRIVSVTTMATPHHGSQTVDVISGLLESSLIADDILEAMADIYASWVGLTSDQELLEQLASMTTAGSDAFNAETPNRPDVVYSSWAGITCNPLDLICSFSRDGETVFAPLITSHLTLQLLEGDNDGLVSEDSAKWGTYMGSVNADHLDEVGHLVGIPDSFDHLGFYASEAARLADLE